MPRPSIDFDNQVLSHYAEKLADDNTSIGHSSVNIVTTADLSGFSTLIVNIYGGMRAEVTIEGYRNGQWNLVEKDVFFYTTFEASLPIRYDQYRVKVRNVGRVTTTFSTQVWGSAAVTGTTMIKPDGKAPIDPSFNKGSRHVQTKPVRRPKHPRLRNFTVLEQAQFDWTHPLSVDPNSTITWYGERGGVVRKSVDRGLTWSDLRDFGAGYEVSMVIPLKNGALVATMKSTSTKHEVWVSDTTQTTWTKKLDITPGTSVVPSYGWSAYDNIVVLSEYGTYHATNTPKNIFYSKDFGVNWSTIWTREVGTGKHQHDVVFDPWANRIWQSYGDNANSNIRYSDDWGATWIPVFAVEGVSQSTSIIPRPHCVLFSSDEEPDGVYRWLRDPADPQAPVNPADIERVYKQKGVSSEYHLGHVGTKPTEIDGILYMPFTGYSNNGYGTLIATPDDEHFFEVYRLTSLTDKGISSVVGIDGNGKLRGIYELSGAKRVWTADPMEWLPKEYPDYLDLGLIVDKQLNAGASASSVWFDDLSWVRKIKISVASDQQIEVSMQTRDSFGQQDYGSTLFSAISATGGSTLFRPMTVIDVGNNSGASGLIGHGAKLTIKNTSASPNTYTKMRVQLFR